MFPRKSALLVSVLATVLAVVLALPALAAPATTGTIAVVDISPPSNLPTSCSGFVRIIFEYSSDGEIAIDYGLTYGGVTTPYGPYLLGGPGRSFGRAVLPFILPDIGFGNTLTLDVTIRDSTMTSVLDSQTLDLTYLCAKSAPSSNPASITEEPVDTSTPPEPPPVTDGRFALGSPKIAVYFDPAVGFQIYEIGPGGAGTIALAVTADDINALPDKPTENTLIASSEDGTIAFYKLTTGEYQINLGPDINGDVQVFIFDQLPPTSFYTKHFNIYDVLSG